MQLGMVGPRRMRANIATGQRAGHEWVVYDVDADRVAELVAGWCGRSRGTGRPGSPRPRAGWLMVPAAITDGVTCNVTAQLPAGDVTRASRDAIRTLHHRL